MPLAVLSRVVWAARAAAAASTWASVAWGLFALSTMAVSAAMTRVRFSSALMSCCRCFSLRCWYRAENIVVGSGGWVGWPRMTRMGADGRGLKLGPECRGAGVSAHRDTDTPIHFF